MKIKILFFVILFSISRFCYGQDNPYVTFGTKPKCEYKIDSSESFFVINKDEKSTILKMAFKLAENEILLYNKNSTVDTLKIKPEEILKFLSVDPLTKHYPELTPYQFASNTPIQAIDIDGLEKYIVVKWYDPQNPNQWTHTTAIKVVNENDRILGANGILYLNFTDNATNRALWDRLAEASKKSATASGNNSYSTAIQNAGIVANGQVVGPDARFSTSETPENAGDRTAIATMEAKFSTLTAGAYDWSVTGSFYIMPAFIGFDYNSSTYNSALDITGSGKDNAYEMNRAKDFLTKNPSATASVTGNSSSETVIVNNSDLANKRGQSAANELKKTLNLPENTSKVTTTDNNYNSAKPKDTKDRNAIINFNYPRR